MSFSLSSARVIGIFLCCCATAYAQSTGDAPAGVVMVDQSAIVPIVIAHRGASGYLPEHTTESAAMSHALGADYIEQDCVITKDGIPIVMHDMVLDDLTNVASVFPERKRDDGHWHVMDFDLAELRRLNVTERRTESRAWRAAGTRFPLEKGSFRINTLAEHLELIQGLNASRNRSAGVYVEIKEPARHKAAGLDATVAILKVLKEYGYDSADAPIFLQCFDEAEVRRIRKELQCPLPLIYLTAQMPSDDKIKECAGFCDGLGVIQTLVVQGKTATGEADVTGLVQKAHTAGLQVHVWTFRTDALPAFVESPEQWIEWLVVKGGVDGVFADQPDYVLNWRNARLTDGKLPGQFRLLKDREN